MVLLLVLLASAAGSVPPRLAAPSSTAQLVADLRAGQVRVATMGSGETVRWSEDWWRWRRAEVPVNGASTEAWLRQRVVQSPRPVIVEPLPDRPPELLAAPAWPPLAVSMLVAGLAAFVLMCLQRRRRLATGIGWFWLFVGGFGAPLFLLLEPRPLWARALPPARWSRLPLGGWGGFLVGWVGVGAVFVLVDLVW